jgi:hypothetical protein
VTTSVPTFAPGMKMECAVTKSISRAAQQMSGAYFAHCKTYRDAHPAARLGAC